jgi:7-cyano-7-deazaguanine synthase in queuosine biosynthesis
MAKDLAIVLNNGSLNSAVATALAGQKHRTVMLYAESGAREMLRSRSAYEQQVAHFKPYREHTLVFPHLAAMGGARQASMSDARYPAQAGMKMLELLPLLATAARFAAHYKATAIYLGLRVGEGKPAGGPAHGADELAQATEFIQIWNEMLEHPCGLPELSVDTPLLELDPWQVVDVGFQTLVPFEKTWSCVEETGDPCWACPGCRTREAAFQQAGKADPIRLVKKK